MNSILIDGSHRTNGNTETISDYLLQRSDMSRIRLLDKHIELYNYNHNYTKQDEFHPLIVEVLQHDHIILMSPMYWYSLSSLMKIFLDRWTDLLKIYKDLGRKLRGKQLSIIYHSNGEKAPYLEEVIKRTAEYLGMHFHKAIHLNMNDDPRVGNLGHERTSALDSILYYS